MTTLFVVHFLALPWNAALTPAVTGASGHPRGTRHAVAAAFRGQPDDLNLRAHPLPAAAAPAMASMTGTRRHRAAQEARP